MRGTRILSRNTLKLIGTSFLDIMASICSIFSGATFGTDGGNTQDFSDSAIGRWDLFSIEASEYLMYVDHALTIYHSGRFASRDPSCGNLGVQFLVGRSYCLSPKAALLQM